MRSRELRWTRDPSLGDTRKLLLDKIDGMAIGDRPETGVFLGEVFAHPVLDFEVRFPTGWRLQNSASAVGASSPRGDAAVYLTADMPEGDLVELADEFAAKLNDEIGAKVEKKQRVKLGEIDAVRYTISGGPAGRALSARITFFPFAGATWRMVGLTPVAAGPRYLPQILLTTRSFQPLSDEHRREIYTNRLRVVLAYAGEDFVALSDRTDNAWGAAVTALVNGELGNTTFGGGELVKILRREAYDAR
jgi:predicted Zn-dependent protease